MRPEAPCVFVVDDDVSVRDALRNLLRSVNLKVVTFGTAEEFLSGMPSDVPGCLVLDVRMPGLSGLDLQTKLAESGRDLPIIFITAHGDIPMSVRAVKEGAVEFLTKPFRDQDLLDAVHQAIELSTEIRKRRKETDILRKRYDSLTRREQQVMDLVVRGLINKQIAAQLNISEATVKLHRGQMMLKMAAESLADLIRMAQSLPRQERES
jgi:FixJ family two-component response regulator